MLVPATATSSFFSPRSNRLKMYKRHDLLWLAFRYCFGSTKQNAYDKKVGWILLKALKVSANMILLRLHTNQPIAAIRRGISSKELGSFSNNCRKEVEEVIWVSVFSHLELLLLCLSGGRAAADGSLRSFFSSSPDQAVPADRRFIQSAGVLVHIWSVYHSAQREMAGLIITSLTENHQPPSTPASTAGGRISGRCHQVATWSQHHFAEWFFFLFED